jgi:ribosomal protein L12E/L44/L45/RPP1/RPP2
MKKIIKVTKTGQKAIKKSRPTTCMEARKAPETKIRPDEKEEEESKKEADEEKTTHECIKCKEYKEQLK